MLPQSSDSDRPNGHRKASTGNASEKSLPSDNPSAAKKSVVKSSRSEPGKADDSKHSSTSSRPKDKSKRRNAPTALSTNDLMPSPPSRPNHPYGHTRGSPAASKSHGNLLEVNRLRDAFEQPEVTGSSPSLSASNNDVPHGIKSNSVPQVGLIESADNRHDSKNSSRSIKTDDPLSPPHRRPTLDTRNLSPAGRGREYQSSNLRTDCLPPDLTFKEFIREPLPDRPAAHRVAAVDSEGEESVHTKPSISSQGQGGGLRHHFVNSSSAKARDKASKFGRSFMNLFSRDKVPLDRQPSPIAPEKYEFNVIRRQLSDQTRITRIAKQLTTAVDKTEYWMPSLPYRCIDYLNQKAINAEGIYRVPGSVKEVKLMQIKFDTAPTYDVDLLDPNFELYDVHIVASVLKNWLLHLPDELLPKSVQSKIQAAHPNATSTPELMQQELAKLSPFKYYLLFAITCHISVLAAHQEQNRMSYDNLFRCFSLPVQIDGYCFNFLVNDWRNCWIGCDTERDTLAAEEEMLDPIYDEMHDTILANDKAMNGIGPKNLVEPNHVDTAAFSAGGDESRPATAPNMIDTSQGEETVPQPIPQTTHHRAETQAVHQTVHQRAETQTVHQAVHQRNENEQVHQTAHQRSETQPIHQTAHQRTETQPVHQTAHQRTETQQVHQPAHQRTETQHDHQSAHQRTDTPPSLANVSSVSPIRLT